MYLWLQFPVLKGPKAVTEHWDMHMCPKAQCLVAGPKLLKQLPKVTIWHLIFFPGDDIYPFSPGVDKRGIYWVSEMVKKDIKMLYIVFLTAQTQLLCIWEISIWLLTPY